MRILALCLVLVAVSSARLIQEKYIGFSVPNAVFNIKDYGAKGDGKVDDTKAVQAAFDACAKANGGTVLVPAGGRFLVFAFHFSGSNTVMEVQKGATIVLNDDRLNWPKVDAITAKGMTNLAITGGGLFDGQGAVWWANRNDFRPRFVYFSGCKNVVFSDVTFKDSPNHNLEMMSDNTEITRVSILAPPSTGTDHPSHNTDAIDVHGTPFYVHDCYLNVGDDNIAAHANHTIVENCRFGTGHGASIGSLCDSWITNVTFRNISFDGTTQAMRIKTKQGCAGEVWDITYEDLQLKNVGTSIVVSMYYTDTAPVEGGETTMRIHDVTFKNINAEHTTQMAGDLECDPNSPCHNINFYNVKHSPAPPKGFECKNCNGKSSDVTPKMCY